MAEENQNKVLPNRIIIRHGRSKPQAAGLFAFELGYCTSDNTLYIGQNSGDPIPVFCFRDDGDGNIRFKNTTNENQG